MESFDIVTLTVNPALDKSSHFKGLVPEQKIRCETPRFDAGGGGINVSKAIARLEGVSKAVFTSGGATGEKLKELIESEKIPFEAIAIGSWTRESFVAVDDNTNLQYRFGFTGAAINETEKAAAEQKQEYNFFVKTFRKKNGKITEFTPFIPYSGFFPRLKNDDRPGPIKGTLSYSIEFPHPFTPKRDSLQFQVYIKDRAGNLSNVATTDVIVLNEF